MSDLDTELHEMFRRRQADIRGAARAPERIVRRVRKRQAITILVGSLVGLVLVAGALAVVRSVAISTPQPTGRGISSSPPATSEHRHQIAYSTGVDAHGSWTFGAYFAPPFRLCTVFAYEKRPPTEVCGQPPGALLDNLFRPAVAPEGDGAAIFGPVSPAATQILLKIDGGGTVAGNLFESRAPYSFFVLTIDHPGHGLLLALDEKNREIARRRVTWPSPPGG